MAGLDRPVVLLLCIHRYCDQSPHERIDVPLGTTSTVGLYNNMAFTTGNTRQPNTIEFSSTYAHPLNKRSHNGVTEKARLNPESHVATG